METDAVKDKRARDLRRAARAEASAWIVRLHGPHRTPALEAGFRKWFEASPENAREFERVTAVWDAGAVPTPGVPRLAHDPEPVRASTSSRGWLLAAMLALVVIGAGGWAANIYWLNPTYSTGLGEQRILRLADGSRVTLNSDSAVVVAYRRHERKIRIRQGEAFFEVAQDASRPFRVRAGDEQIEAIGTEFNVWRQPQQLTVTLVRGKVAVTGLDEPPAGAGADQTGGEHDGRLMMSEGQRLTVPESGGPPQIDEPRIDAVTAWLRGEAILDGTPLAGAIAEMNRYDQRRLVIDDPTVGAMRISGIYHTGDNELFASMVARLYGFSVEHHDGRIYLSKPGEPAADKD